MNFRASSNFDSCIRETALQCAALDSSGAILKTRIINLIYWIMNEKG